MTASSADAPLERMNYPQGPGGYGPPQGYRPPQPPPKRGGVSVLAVVGIVVLCGFAGCIVCVAAVTHKSPAEKASDEAARKKAAADQASKTAADQAVQDLLEKKLRAACKSNAVKVPDESRVKSACRDHAQQLALSPNSVSFPGLFDVDGTVTQSGCSMQYFSWLEAKNAFNATIRTHYKCVFNPVAETTTVELLR